MPAPKLATSLHKSDEQQFAQELLQTFSTSIGEISLVPVTGGVFAVNILHAGSDTDTSSEPVETVLWDRKAEGGFPETKELKNRVRNIIDPSKDMGHIDRRLRKDKAEKEEVKGGGNGSASAAPPIELEKTTVSELSEALQRQREDCEDCK